MSAPIAVKAPLLKAPLAKEEMFGTIHPASSGSISDDRTGIAGDRTGIERAFDVIRHHTVHTKGYVMTALELIQEFGTAQDKKMLADLLQEKQGAVDFAK
ncbi:MAG TPA: hypothetical protein VGM92_09195, partial [Candidatus Kapabacteria bacterium]